MVAATDEDSTVLVVSATSATEDAEDGAVLVRATASGVNEEAPLVTVTKVIEQSEFTDVEGANI